MHTWANVIEIYKARDEVCIIWMETTGSLQNCVRCHEVAGGSGTAHPEPALAYVSRSPNVGPPAIPFIPGSLFSTSCFGLGTF
jgi:hypothetical protein